MIGGVMGMEGGVGMKGEREEGDVKGMEGRRVVQGGRGRGEVGCWEEMEGGKYHCVSGGGVVCAMW